MSEELKKLATKKLVENLLSVKVWIIFTLFGLTTFLVLKGAMTGDAYAAVNGGVISTVLAIREGIKVAKINAGDSKKANEIIT